MKVESREENSELIIELRFDANEQICLKHDLVDIVDWYARGPSKEKIYNCQKRMIKDSEALLMSDPSMSNMSVGDMQKLKSDPMALCDAISKLPTYKNRKEREENAMLPI